MPRGGVIAIADSDGQRPDEKGRIPASRSRSRSRYLPRSPRHLLCLAGHFGVTMPRFAVLVVLFSLRAATAFHLGANTRNESIAASAKVESAFTVCSRRNALEEMVRDIGVCMIPLIISNPSPSFAEEQSGVGERRHVGIAATKATNSIATTPDLNPPSAIECDEECKEQRRRRIEDRRAMMRQSRSTSSRQEVFELSKQRARLYGSEYQGLNCIDGVPCL